VTVPSCSHRMSPLKTGLLQMKYCSILQGFCDYLQAQAPLVLWGRASHLTSPARVSHAQLPRLSSFLVVLISTLLQSVTALSLALRLVCDNRTLFTTLLRTLPCSATSSHHFNLSPHCSTSSIIPLAKTPNLIDPLFSPR
jgi:hypothetical protein